MYLQKALTIILPQSKNSLRGGSVLREWFTSLTIYTVHWPHSKQKNSSTDITAHQSMKISLANGFRNILSWFKHNCSITKEEQLTRSTKCKAHHQYILQVKAGVIHENHHSAASLTSSPSIKHKEHTSPSYKFINRRGRGQKRKRRLDKVMADPQVCTIMCSLSASIWITLNNNSR